MKPSAFFTFCAAAIVSKHVAGQSYKGPEDPRLEIALNVSRPCNGVSVTPDGRVFLIFQGADGSTGHSIVEYNTTTKYVFFSHRLAHTEVAHDVFLAHLHHIPTPNGITTPPEPTQLPTSSEPTLSELVRMEVCGW